jgi:SAM-dependent methyltransferase
LQEIRPHSLPIPRETARGAAIFPRPGANVSAVAGHAHQRRDWEDLASFDSYGAILRPPERKGQRWEEEEFLATGQRDAERILEAAAVHSLPRRFGSALDFGCGVGRVTRALAARFDEVAGVDISATMIDRARTVTSSFGNCRFVVGAAPALRALPAQHYDLVVSILVLQHLPSAREAELTVTMLAGRVAPGGALIVQVPRQLPLRRRLQSRRRAYALLRNLGVAPRLLLGRFGLDPIRTTALSEARVRRAIEDAGAILVAAEDDDATGLHVPSRRYLATRSDS